jgi:ABC-type uncharacterized transport system substrate-binding protein
MRIWIIEYFFVILFFLYSGSAESEHKKNELFLDYPEYVYLDINSSVDYLQKNNKDKETKKTVDCKKTMRLALVQKGPHYEFKTLIRALLIKLSEDGYINLPAGIPIDFDYDDPKIWKSIAQSSAGSCLELIEDGYYSTDWSDVKWEPLARELKTRIVQNKDIDILLGMGVATGVKFADPTLGIPVMIADAASPESAGVVGPGKFSTKANVHVQKYPKRISMAINNYHNILGFKNLGMIADKSEDIQKAQSFNVIMKTVENLGVNFHYCLGDIYDASNPHSQEEFIRCRDELIDHIDALFLPVFDGTSEKRFFNYIRPLVEKNIAVISESRIDEVKKGALISLVEESFEESGRFEADVLEKIINGQKPETINQYYHTNLSFALNIKTAKMINWKPSFELLMSVVYLFDTIDFN